MPIENKGNRLKLIFCGLSDELHKCRSDDVQVLGLADKSQGGKHLAEEKQLDRLLQKTDNFDPSDQTETGNAEEQPAKDNLTSENNKMVGQSATSPQSYFLSNA